MALPQQQPNHQGDQHWCYAYVAALCLAAAWLLLAVADRLDPLRRLPPAAAADAISVACRVIQAEESLEFARIALFTATCVFVSRIRIPADFAAPVSDIITLGLRFAVHASLLLPTPTVPWNLATRACCVAVLAALGAPDGTTRGHGLTNSVMTIILLALAAYDHTFGGFLVFGSWVCHVPPTDAVPLPSWRWVVALVMSSLTLAVNGARPSPTLTMTSLQWSALSWDWASATISRAEAGVCCSSTWPWSSWAVGALLLAIASIAASLRWGGPGFGPIGRFAELGHLRAVGHWLSHLAAAAAAILLVPRIVMPEAMQPARLLPLFITQRLTCFSLFLAGVAWALWRCVVVQNGAMAFVVSLLSLSIYFVWDDSAAMQQGDNILFAAGSWLRSTWAYGSELRREVAKRPVFAAVIFFIDAVIFLVAVAGLNLVTNVVSAAATLAQQQQQKQQLLQLQQQQQQFQQQLLLLLVPPQLQQQEPEEQEQEEQEQEQE